MKRILLLLLFMVSISIPAARYYLYFIVESTNGRPLQDQTVALYDTSSTTKLYDLTWDKGGYYYATSRPALDFYDVRIQVGSTWHTIYDNALIAYPEINEIDSVMYYVVVDDTTIKKTGDTLQIGALKAANIPSSIITSGHIFDGTITTADIYDGTIIGADISSGTIEASDLGNYIIGSTKIDTGAVIGLHLGTSVADTLDNYTNNGLATDNGHLYIQVRTGGGLNLASGGVGINYDNSKITFGTQLTVGTIDSSDIKDGTILSADIAPEVYYDICLYALHTLADSAGADSADNFDSLEVLPSDNYDQIYQGQFYKVAEYDSVVFVFVISDGDASPEAETDIRFYATGYLDTLRFSGLIFPEETYRQAYSISGLSNNAVASLTIEIKNTGDGDAHRYKVVYVGLRANLGE